MMSQTGIWARGIDEYSDGSYKGFVSLIISEWGKEGILYGKEATQCSQAEIVDEVWAQMKAHWDEGLVKEVEQAELLDVHFEPGLRFEPDGIHYDEPLFINTKGSWKNRPTTSTRIGNFVLAGDYTRTFADVACMESACESGKRAANVILASEDLTDRYVEIHPLGEPVIFRLNRKFDEWMYKHWG